MRFVILSLLLVAFLGIWLHDEPSPDEVHVVASAQTTTSTTVLNDRAVPDLGPRFAELVAAYKKPRPRARTAPTARYRAAGVAVYPTDEWLHRLAMCETGGTMNQRIVSRTNPPYYSYFQWELGTWRSVGGTGDPRDWSYEAQVPLARRLILRSGWGQFPKCSRAIGAR